MEQKFQTSFIPKRPLTGASPSSSIPASPRRGSSSLFMTLATLVFIASLVAAGGAFAYKEYLIKDQVAQKNQLAEREKQFNTDLIEELKQVNVKIDAARQLLKYHVAMSQIFQIISRLTIEHVRFLAMDVTTPATQNDGVKVSLRGYGTSFSAVAFQSDVLGSLEQYGLRKVVKNPILSDPSLDGGGTVSFGFTATIDPDSLSYQKFIAGSQAQSAPGDAAASGAGQ